MNSSKFGTSIVSNNHFTFFRIEWKAHFFLFGCTPMGALLTKYACASSMFHFLIYVYVQLLLFLH